MNKMIKAINIAGEIVYIPVDSGVINQIVELSREAGCRNIEVFEAGSMKLENLPEEIQEKVKEVLKAYRRVSVIFEYGKFEVSVGSCIKANYHWDHFVCGRYEDKEVYSEEERRLNYKEVFG